MFFIPYYILILVITIIVDYVAAIWIERSGPRKKKLFLWISIISTLLILFVFKYYNFFIHNFNDIARLIGWNYSLAALTIILPIGLSFHTFQSLSYVIEVYRGNQKAETHFGIYCLYVMYYPQLVAGPIERPQNLLHQFRRFRSFKFVNFYRGLRLIIYGLFMKLVVADRLSIYVDTIYNNSDKHNGTSLALASFFFSFQIYCDFAGYSAIAIGSSRVMGISLMTNFRRPYLSETVGEFWRRWHISLSTWFKDYVYVTLGGNRVKSKLRTNVNLLITFVISGFWHGASWTFVIWGGLNGLYLTIENSLKSVAARLKVKSIPSLFKNLYVFLLITLTWVFFRSTSLNQSLSILKKIFSFDGKLFTPSDPEILIDSFLAIFLIIAFEIFYEEIYAQRKIKKHVMLFNNAFMLFLIVSILLLGVFDGGQFIYFQF